MRYRGSDYLFGKEPSHVLLERSHYFTAGQVALMVADGEGRNGVYLAQLGLKVHSVDGSIVASRKAKKLADEVGVEMVIENANVLDWDWYDNAYDHVVGIMCQIVGGETKHELFDHMKGAVKPGGYVLVHGFRPEQVELGTGGPGDPEFMYASDMLRDAFSGFEILEISEEDRPGGGDMQALITLVARKPITN